MHVRWALRRYDTEVEVNTIKAKLPKKKKGINTLKTFPSTTSWVPLVPNVTAVKEPENSTFKAPRAPNILAVNAQFAPKKYKFTDTFVVPSFTGIREVPVRDHRGKQRVDQKGVPIKQKQSRMKGHVNNTFRQKHSLLSRSFP